ncbi:MAG: 4Fe-4S dicluster domain-containing protein [Methanomassiliicoccaceae archaeon]|nr:4Fe-4S dicluster domain-containing protein [Methanomassiliicoccaceae archaeon]
MADTGCIVSMFSLSSCTKCGECDKVCPSGRNGGIRPDAVVSAIINAATPSDISFLYKEVWKCLMCHRCSMNCPREIDIVGAIRYVRYTAATKEGPPQRFSRSGSTLAAEGRTFPVNDTVNKKRLEVGLKEIKKDNGSLEELRTIMSRTGFCNE